MEFANVLARLPNLRIYRVANAFDVVTRVPPSYIDYQHVGRMIWIHGGGIGLPRRFGTQALPLYFAHLFCCVTTGVADHSMDLYLDCMCGKCSWARYLRYLEMHARPDMYSEGRSVTTRVARLLQPRSQKHMTDLANTAISMRASTRAASVSTDARQTKTVRFTGGGASAASLASSVGEHSAVSRPASIESLPAGSSALMGGMGGGSSVGVELPPVVEHEADDAAPHEPSPVRPSAATLMASRATSGSSVDLKV